VLWLAETRPFGGHNPPREGAKVAIVGLPLDGTGTFRVGSRFGPESLRRVSESLEWYSYIADRPVPEVGYHDFGDVVMKPGDPIESLARIEEVLAWLAGENGMRVVAIGGEHTVLYGARKLLASGDTLLVVFDAHADVRDDYLGSKINHATVLRRVLEEVPEENVVLVGTRAVSEEEERFLSSSRVQVVPARRIWAYGVREPAARLRARSKQFAKVCISIDMDVFDPAFAPGVGAPEPLGLDPHTVFAILGSLLTLNNVVYFEVVETNPLFDVGAATSALAAKLVLETLYFMATPGRGSALG